LVAPPPEGLTGTQKRTVALTAVSAVLLLISGILVLTQIGIVDAVPGFVQFVVFLALVVGMARQAKIAFLGALVASGIFALLGIGAFLFPTAAFGLSWFPALHGVTIVVELVIAVVAWRSLREM